MYTAPDTTTPALQLANVADDGISFEPRTAFAPDPLLPDLDEYCQPHGLSIHNLNGDASGLLIPNPPVDDLLAYEVPSGLAINPHPFAADPLLPDLQHPELTLEVTMSQRPGELDPSALETLHSQPDSAQLDDASYPQVFLDQSGVNTTRRRHLDLLFRGLDAEEEGTTLDGMGTPPQPPRLSRRQRSRKGLAGDDASDNDGI
ncbi:hypothetical protein EPA93_09205 [Ktedonosporobacter rubrisoli]|uniref:Uncharacterized protein n=1 Tax=Ktedonosporobacter rubrisoli TaxID=2509675 RepID=A0A4P6JN77_KTERU|nr:hypothetical protein [Ktedonosporobacter rubrisoli]QBD76176.1 hypothetical protein EPA93_09205 [Ktedonosporobacter rubrisoli]